MQRIVYPWLLMTLDHPWADISNGAPVRYGQGECLVAEDSAAFGSYKDYAWRLCGTWVIELPGPAIKGPEKEALEMGLNRTIFLRYDTKFAPVWRRDNDKASHNPEFDAFIEFLLCRLQEFQELHQDILMYADETKRIKRVYSISHVLWNNILARFNTDDDKALRGLIVKHSQRMQPHLRTIVQGPKRVLQRIHQSSRLDRIQEQDAYCLLDYSRRPGRTAPEKAGSRQRLLAVQRRESFNTLENRVVLDFCRRSILVCRNYLKEHPGLSSKTSERYASVEKYHRFLMTYVQDWVWADVKSMQVPCRTPNYVLSQNPVYIEVWKSYIDLLQHADLRERIWRWPRRAWADLVRVLISKSLQHLFLRRSDCFPLAERPVYVTKNLSMVRLFSKPSYPGGWRIERHNKSGCFYVVDRDDVEDFFANAKNISACNADVYLTWIPDAAGTPAKLIPVWGMVGDMDKRDIWQEWMGSLSSAISAFKVNGLALIDGAMVVCANWRTGQMNDFKIRATNGIPIWLRQIRCVGGQSFDMDTIVKIIQAPMQRLIE